MCEQKAVVLFEASRANCMLYIYGTQFCQETSKSGSHFQLISIQLFKKKIHIIIDGQAGKIFATACNQYKLQVLKFLMTVFGPQMVTELQVNPFLH